jgi:hypothetical protein
MKTIADRWASIWNSIKGSPAEVVRSIAIPRDNVIESGKVAPRFEPGQDYFAVLVNEMYLTRARQWMDVYDPMALVVSEFTYGGEPRVVPFVVGPSLVQDKMQQVPNGMIISDTLVAGVHPYAGGKLALSIVLGQVKRESYAKGLLNVVEKVAGAFPAGKALEPHLKIANAVLEGIESLFGMGDTVALVGHRWEYNDGLTPWLEPGFFALIAADEKNLNPANLGVVKGRLRSGTGVSASEYRANDFVLYSLCPLTRRTDITELPLHRLFQTALRDAVSSESGSWERAKAGLVSLHQELLTSPDLTWPQVQQLMEEFSQKIRQEHERAKSYTVLGKPLSEIGPFRGPEAEQRLNELGRIHRLLALE